MKKVLWAGLSISLLVLGIIVGQRVDSWENIFSRDDSISENPYEYLNVSEAVKRGKLLSYGSCEGEQKPKLSALPMKYEDFSFIIPYGLVVDDHVTPIDHQYFSPTIFNSPRDTYEVRAMGDARLVDIGERTTERGIEYRLVFSMSCKLFYYYDLVTSLTPELQKVYEESKSDFQRGAGHVNIPVTAGQLIGRIGGQTLDFAVWDTDVRLSGFVDPEQYEAELWKIHTADPLNYYTDELKEQVLSKYMRTADPVSGKIDYDIDGKLVGTWFREGSGGYAPKNASAGDYWKSHLVFTYDNYDPTSIVISIGDYNGEPEQFGVKGNVPDPGNVDVSSGMIKYELVLREWADPQTGKLWDHFSFVKGLVVKNPNSVVGTVLVQMLDKRKMRFEIFPRESAFQVSGFTENAKVFER